MKTAVERYAEAMDRLDDKFADGRLHDEWVASIEAAVAEERTQWRAWLDRMQKVQELEIEEEFDPAPDKRLEGGR